MCIGIPGKDIKIKDKKATVSQGNHLHQVDMSLISEKIKKGDFIFVASGVGINKVEKEEAKKILALIAALPNR